MSTAVALKSIADLAGTGYLKKNSSARNDWSFDTPAGTGDVVGPGSATDHAIARFDTTTGKLIQDSSAILDDSNNLTGLASLTLTNTGLHLLDTDASHDLIVAPGSNLTADRTLTVTTGDADRTLTLNASVTLNQDLETTDIPQFAGLGIGTAGSSGNLEVAAGAKILPASDSTTAIQVANAAGTAFAWWDSTNLRYYVEAAGARIRVTSTSSAPARLEANNTSTGQARFSMMYNGTDKFYLGMGGAGVNMFWWDQAANIGIFDYLQSSSLLKMVPTQGNVTIGGTTMGASAQAALAIFNGTAPTGSVTNGVMLYAEDVSASSELKVRDEAGNVTTLSPHDFRLVGGPSEPMAWSYYSEREGMAVNVDMLRAMRVLERLSGETLVHIERVN